MDFPQCDAELNFLGVCHVLQEICQGSDVQIRKIHRTIRSSLHKLLRGNFTKTPLKNKKVNEGTVPQVSYFAIIMLLETPFDIYASFTTSYIMIKNIFEKYPLQPVTVDPKLQHKPPPH